MFNCHSPGWPGMTESQDCIEFFPPYPFPLICWACHTAITSQTEIRDGQPVLCLFPPFIIIANEQAE